MEPAAASLKPIRSHSAVMAAIVESIGEIAVAPAWWYTGGLLAMGRWWLASMKMGLRRLSLRVLLSHWLQPMFGQYDRAGRIISFVMRTIIMVWHVIMMNVWFVVVTVILAGYVALPPFAVWQLLVNLA